MSRAGTLRSNTVGRTVETIDLLGWRPSWFSAELTVIAATGR